MNGDSWPWKWRAMVKCQRGHEHFVVIGDYRVVLPALTQALGLYDSATCGKPTVTVEAL